MTDQPLESRPVLKTLFVAAWFCFAVLILGLLLALVSTRRKQTAVENQIVSLQLKRAQLQAKISEEEALKRSAEDDRELIESVFALFRDIDDIPEFTGPRILSKQIQEKNLFLYVPDGNHRLKVTIVWTVEPKPTPDSDKDTGENQNKQQALESNDKVPQPKLTSGKREWTINLLPDSNYHFHLSGFRYTSDTISWRLDSNHEKFDTITQELPLPEFRMRAGSWGYRSFIGAPNAMNGIAWRNRETELTINGGPSPARSSTQTVFSARKRGQISEQPITVDVQITLESEGAPTVAASLIDGRLKASKALEHLEYLGEGFYAEKIVGNSARPDGEN